MPEADYQLIAEIQTTCLAGGLAATKSGILRAALQTLHQLPQEDLIELLQALDPVKVGRPKAPQPA